MKATRMSDETVMHAAIIELENRGLRHLTYTQAESHLHNGVISQADFDFFSDAWHASPTGISVPDSTRARSLNRLRAYFEGVDKERSMLVDEHQVQIKLDMLADYVESGANRCPNTACLSENIESRPGTKDDNYAVMACGCNDCGSTWEDVYKLSYAINLEIGDE